jgi:hypothetical protein
MGKRLSQRRATCESAEMAYLCWIAQGSGFESQRGHLFFGISPRGEISQEGFAQGLVSPPATGLYKGSVRIISEAPFVCPNGCWYLLKKWGVGLS